MRNDLKMPRRYFSRDTHATILAGVVSSLLVIYFIEPILSALGRAFLAVASIVASSYLDRMYTELAVDRPDAGVLAMIVVGATALAYLTAAPFLPTIGRLAYERGRKEARQELKETGTISEKPIVDRFFLAVVALPAVIALGISVDFYIRTQTATSFEQHVTILSPRIGDHLTRELRAQYASMESAQDYAELRMRLYALAEEHSVHLPPNRLYPLLPLNP